MLIRCLSPVGRVSPGDKLDEIAEGEMSDGSLVRIGAILDTADRSYDMTVEGDVLLGDAEHDATRVGALILRVTTQADWLERHLLPGRDEPLDTFENDLRQESVHAG